ncbi:hypothetical protein N9251_03200 [Gammaproteobacteria bacterium]|nr:hypothetical protein [Gammaproteobacteria bacterium]
MNNNITSLLGRIKKIETERGMGGGHHVFAVPEAQRGATLPTEVFKIDPATGNCVDGMADYLAVKDHPKAVIVMLTLYGSSEPLST